MTGDTTFGFHSLYRAVSSATASASSSSLPSPGSRDANLQPLCTRATDLGNNISVRLVELLTSLKHTPASLHGLANEFLDITRILWSIESGLAKARRRDSGESLRVGGEWEPSGEEVRATIFSPGMSEVLEARLRQTVRDFEALDGILSKYLDAQKKGPVARLQSRWRRMFADRDLERMRVSLTSARDSLRAIALVFQCSLGNGPTEQSICVGYSGLAAALDTKGRKPDLGKKPEADKKNGDGKRPGLGQRAATADLVKFRWWRGSRSTEASDEGLPRCGASDGQAEDWATNDRSSSVDQSSNVDQASEHSAPPTATDHASKNLMAGRSVSDTVGPARAETPPRPLSSTRARAATDGASPLPRERSAARRSSVPREPSTKSRQPPSRDLSSMRRPSLTTPDASLSSSLSDAGTWVDEMKTLELPEGEEGIPHIKADPDSMPRWSARDDATGNVEGLKLTLISALEMQNHRIVEQVLDKGVSPDSSDTHLLRQAVLNHDTESLLLLFLFGADANRTDTDGMTPLYSAVHVDFPEGAKVLLKYGADPNKRMPDDESPLDLAVAKGDPEMTRVLLVYGGDPNIYPPEGRIPLNDAITSTSGDNLAELLLDYGADPNAKDIHGRTPLCEAVRSDRTDRVEAVESLLNHGADPNFPGPEHVLWYTTYRPECMQMLLDRGADPRLAAGVLELATSMNKPQSVRKLLAAGVHPDAKKDGLYTPLCTAIRDGREEIVRILLEAGSDPNAEGPEFPLRQCVVNGRNRLLPVLVKAGAEVRRVPSILEGAAGAGNVLGLAWLLRHGADPNEAAGVGGHTPLTRAISEDLSEAVDILLSFGADPEVRGRDWPVRLAVGKPGLLMKVGGKVKDINAYEGLVVRAEEERCGESVRTLRELGYRGEGRGDGELKENGGSEVGQDEGSEDGSGSEQSDGAGQTKECGHDNESTGSGETLKSVQSGGVEGIDGREKSRV